MNNSPSECNTARPYSFLGLVERVCERPRAFVLSGSFGEVSALLEGFADGLAVSGPGAESEWESFKKWLPKRLGYPRNFVWFAALSRLYPDGSAALEQLTLLYREYISHEPNESTAEIGEEGTTT